MIWIPLILILVSYLLVSLILFFFPSLLHESYRYPKVPIFSQALSGQRVLRIAHRGGPRIKTQNTIEGFEQSLKHSDMLQMDVCQTKDGVLVVHHDHDLQRTCGVKTFIRDIQYKDLPPFKKDIELNFAPQGLTVHSNGQRIPTLVQVFQKFPNVPMNIELKTPTLKGIKQMVSLLKIHNRLDNTFVGIRGKMMEILVDIDFRVMRFMGDKDFFFYFIALIFGFLPFVYVSENTMQIPLWTQQFQQWKVREWGNNWKTRFWFKILKILNYFMRILAYHMRKRGIMTYYWVCNSQDDFRRAIKFGGCGIMTDNPPLLDQYLSGMKLTGLPVPSELEKQMKDD